MQRVIITGGTGMIGQPLAKQLAKAGYEVIVLSRNPARVAGLASISGIQVIRWDAKTPQGWGPLADGAFAIINLAGENLAGGRWTGERKRAIIDSRVDAAKAVVAAIEQASVKPEVVVQASAVGYYGPRGNDPVTEDGPPGTTFDAQVCVTWEQASDPVVALGVRRVIIRTGIVLDKNAGALSQMAIPFKLFAGGPIASGQQVISWIHLADEVNAIQWLMENPAAEGAFNVSAPNPVTNKELAQALGKTLGRPSYLPVPAFALKAMFGEMANVLLTGQRAVPARLQEMGYPFKFSAIQAALDDIYRQLTL